MIKLRVLTRWTNDILDGSNVSLVWSDLLASGALAYDGRETYTDQPTGQPASNIIPDPNAVIVELVLYDAAYDWLYDAPDYGPGAILWSETV